MTQLLLTSKVLTLNTQFQDGSLRRPLAATSSVENILCCSGSTQPPPNPFILRQAEYRRGEITFILQLRWRDTLGQTDKVSLISLYYIQIINIYLSLQGFLYF